MDQRTRQCVQRMQPEDIASLPEATFKCAMRLYHYGTGARNGAKRAKVNLLRRRFINAGMDPDRGQQWIRR